ncbi:alpha/beta fold hydrolase [Endozoicomonas elysicola]|uniref:Alpha/beta hydrolase n=1 Tax=Endozoicomonas elysicola TaxID=305900 RepID=A0A081K8N7_9GAMM|nr:alpha/beta hydrolase [Endozoicomonas elysicola]KEI70513.1 alpha/beta hydrolase [Endozoicomonas elysicola]
METVKLSDGRTLTYDTYGDPHGFPVIFSHGFADSRLIRNPDDNIAKSLGLWMIAADQPGVGGSTPKKDRRMVDWGPDMEQLADHLDLGKFAVAGHSGGGPHALSIALHMPERVTHGVLASPAGPFDEDGFAKMLVMKDLKLVVKLHHFHNVLKWAYKMDIKKAKKDIGSYVENIAEGDPSDADTFLSNPAQREMFEASFTTGMEQGSEGVYEMTLALWHWGFELEDITQHFDVFYGDADDIISPEMPKRVADRLPNSTATIWKGAGHYGFIDTDRWSQFLGALKHQANRTAI